MKHLYIIRHGQTLFNLRKKIQGWCDSPLTELGKKQAILARESIKNISFDHYYSSTSERCCDTIELLIEHKNYKRCKGIKEVNFGLFEGESEDLNPKWENGYAEIFPKYGGESPQEAGERASETYRSIMNLEDHKCVLAVSHAGITMNFIRCEFGEVFLRETFFKNGRFNNCDMLHLTYDGSSFNFVDIIRLKSEE